ncbi:hypothetical protein ACLBW0_21715 [Enterobacteriaceae bacterium C34A]
MNRLNELYIKARAGLSPYDRTPESALKKMARQCGRDEISAIHIRILLFQAELAMVEGWDGDEQDMIWEAISELRVLLGFIDSAKPT